MKRFCQVVAIATIFAGGSISSEARGVGSWNSLAADARPAIALLGATALAAYAAWRFARVMNDEPSRR